MVSKVRVKPVLTMSGVSPLRERSPTEKAPSLGLQVHFSFRWLVLRSYARRARPCSRFAHPFLPILVEYLARIHPCHASSRPKAQLCYYCYFYHCRKFLLQPLAHRKSQRVHSYESSPNFVLRHIKQTSNLGITQPVTPLGSLKLYNCSFCGHVESILQDRCAPTHSECG